MITYKREIEQGICKGEIYTEKVLAVYIGINKMGFIIKDKDIKEYFFATSLDGDYRYSGVTQTELKEILQQELTKPLSKKDLFLQLNPLEVHSIINQINQLVVFYMNPKNEDLPIIAIIGTELFNTGFFDTEDFFDNSDYNPVLINGVIKLHYEI